VLKGSGEVRLNFFGGERRMANQGGDRGKSPNETGTQPATKKKDYPNPKAGKGASGQGSGKSRQGGPKKTAARTTKKSRDK